MDPTNQNTAKRPERKQEDRKAGTGGSVLTTVTTLFTRAGEVEGVTTKKPANSASDIRPEVAGYQSKLNPEPTVKNAGGSKGETGQTRVSERSQEQNGSGPELQAPATTEPAAQTPVSNVGETKPINKSGPSDNSRKESAKDKGRAEEDGQASAKRVRPNETISSNVDTKKQKLNQTRDNTRPMSNAAAVQASKGMEVAVTSSTRRFISREMSTKIENFLLAEIDKIANVATLSSNSKGPMFHGRPTYMDGSLRLICEDEKTVQWVNKCLEELNYPEQIIALGPGEIPIRVHIGINLPGLELDITLIRKRLLISNPWADFRTWLVYSMRQTENNSTFMVFIIPEDEKIKIMARERRLCYCLGSVFVKFRDSKGRFVSTPPGNDDTSRQKEVSTTTPQKPCPKPGDEASTSTQAALI